MAYTGEMRLSDGTGVLVEIADTEAGGIDRVGRASSVARGASETLQEALAHVRPALDAVAGSVRGMVHPPETVRVDFGIKLSAEAGVVIARAATEANFTVSLEWRTRDDTARPSPGEPSAAAE
ncbi:hypothetical protein GCM10010420_45310 [Streptomyces glaucosporus]|uniref:Trypsin-co-occurring domain-containing protein n=1 Tax=Streptomyces glaucosporus TaxID=284044 RepID=A0ABP5VT88_9ACTN